jgi:hypothetical protein
MRACSKCGEVSVAWDGYCAGRCREVTMPSLAAPPCSAHERAEAIIKDILVNHLPRIEEGLRAGYIDENQILVMYDHAVRARILKEHAQNILSQPNKCGTIKYQKKDARS